MNSDMLYHGTQRACTRQEQRIVRPLSCQFFFQVSCFCAVCHHESKDFGVNRRCSSLTLQAAKQRPGFRKHIGFLDHRQHKSSTAAGGESLGLKTEATGAAPARMDASGTAHFLCMPWIYPQLRESLQGTEHVSLTFTDKRLCAT